MEFYSVLLKPSVEKDFRGLPKAILSRVFSAIENLGEEPFPSKAAKLEGMDRTFRIRIGDYRIIYEVEKTKKVITILYVRHRREVYRRF
ncbi:MAG: type II toxin-antitoxin system RelE/ParE family toxin [Acidobacteria bacterium]|nr:type II toxin-antitoxin system RelE/ParE family toxin [Acidobacteriota bacterium]